MPNEIRPCTLWGQTFDACYVLKLSTSYVRANTHHVFIGGEWVSSPTETGRYVVVSTTSRRYFSPLVKTGEERQALLLEAITAIAKALNPPIRVTQKVLKAMDKVPEAKFSASWGDLINWYRCYQTPLLEGAFTWRASSGLRLTTCEDYYIQADCPLALQALFPFNEEGELFDA